MATVSRATNTVQVPTISMAVQEIRMGARARKDLGDLEGLMQRIEQVVLLHPIVVTPDSQLIAGARRLEACKRLGWTDIPVHVVPLDDVLLGEYAENAFRKDFTRSEAVAIAEA